MARTILFFAAIFSVLLAAISADDSKPNRVCGKKLLRHAAAICNAVECDKEEQSNPPASAEGALKNLAHTCCTIGCSNELIASFCCRDPSKPEPEKDDVNVAALTDVVVL